MVNGQLHAPAALLPWKILSTYGIRGLSGCPTAGVDVLEKIKVFCLYRDSNPGLSGQ